jgi:predicted nucleic-acid-binding protein
MDKERVVMPKEYSDSDYYWEKAEFQDPVAHRQHVENYKKGIRDSIAFDKQYMKEAEEELKMEEIACAT